MDWFSDFDRRPPTFLRKVDFRENRLDSTAVSRFPSESGFSQKIGKLHQKSPPEKVRYIYYIYTLYIISYYGGVVWYGVVWLVWCGLVGVVWLVWSGLVGVEWCGVVW